MSSQIALAELAWPCKQSELSLQQENDYLQEKVRELEENLQRAMMDVQALKLRSGGVSGMRTPSTCASSSTSTPRVVGFAFDEVFVPPPPGLPWSPAAERARCFLRPPPGLSALADEPLSAMHPPSPPGALASDQPLKVLLSPAGSSLGRVRPAPLEMESIQEQVPVAARASLEWRIDNVHGKLRTSCGFPLISPVYNSLAGVPDLRFHLVPGERWAEEHKRARGSRRSRPEAAEKASPYGALKLKVGNPDGVGTLRFHLSVGAASQGPAVCDFGGQGVQSVDLEFDWLEQVTDAKQLHLRFEFF